MKCKEGDILHTYDYDDEFLILESGNASRKGRRYARGEYCIEVCCHLPDIKCTGGASYLSQDFIMFIHVSCQGLPGQYVATVAANQPEELPKTLSSKPCDR